MLEFIKFGVITLAYFEAIEFISGMLPEKWEMKFLGVAGLIGIATFIGVIVYAIATSDSSGSISVEPVYRR